MNDLAPRSAPKTRGAVLRWQAPFYDAECAVLGLREKFRQETLRHAQLSPGERILDVGCGTGILTRLASERVGPLGEVLGLDPSPPMITIARKNAVWTESRAQFELGVIEHLPFADAHFDVVLSSLMLHHLPVELKRAGLREVYRVLKPGGRLLVVDFDRPGNFLWWLVAWPQLFMPSLRANVGGEIPYYLDDAGFSRVRSVGRWFNWLTFWTATR